MATKKKTTAKKPSPASKKKTAAPAPARKKKASASTSKAPAKKAAKKKAAPRKVPKVSAHKGSSILQWAEQKMETWQQEILHAIHAIVEKEAPRAQAVIKWAQPVFEEGGPFAFVRAARQHVTFGFWRGAELKDPDGVLEGDGDRMKHLKLKSLADLKAPYIVRFIRDAVKLNREKGDPTRK